MQEVEFAGKTLRFQMSPMASILYTDEFDGRDLLEDYGKEATGNTFNLILNMRVLWASSKAVNPSMPNFKLWMRNLPQSALDVQAFSADVLPAIVDEYKDAFFPGVKDGEAAPGKPKA